VAIHAQRAVRDGAEEDLNPIRIQDPHPAQKGVDRRQIVPSDWKKNVAGRGRKRGRAGSASGFASPP
jgi:hypothetical protein